MEKKAYITPEVVIEDIELEATMQAMSDVEVITTEVVNDDEDEEGF